MWVIYDVQTGDDPNDSGKELPSPPGTVDKDANNLENPSDKPIYTQDLYQNSSCHPCVTQQEQTDDDRHDPLQENQPPGG